MTTSDTPKGKMLFSSPENLASWGPSADSGVIACMTAADAKKAEALFNALREQLAERDQELSNLSKSYEGMDDTWADMVVRLRAELAEKDAALAVCVGALRMLENSDCRAIGKIDKCAHGKYGYEDCETCFSDFACTVLTSLPQSTKQDGK